MGKNAPRSGPCLTLFVPFTSIKPEDWPRLTPLQQKPSQFLPPTLAEEVMFSVLSVCPSVCVSVSACTIATKTIGLTDLKIGIHVYLDNISDKFEGEGHGSKVKVTKVKNVKLLFSAYYQKMRSKVKVTRSRSKVMRSMSKSQSQGHSTGQGYKVKIVLVHDYC